VHWKEEEEWFAGNVTARQKRIDDKDDEESYTYAVAYDDGDVDENVDETIVRATRQGAPLVSEPFGLEGCETEDHAVRALETTGFVAFKDLIPRVEVAALRDRAEKYWCDVARAFAARNLTHCLAWGLPDRDAAYADKPKCPDITKNSYQHTNELHWPYVQLVQELALGNDDPVVVDVVRRAMARLFPALERINANWRLQERGFSMNQARFGGQWHIDGGDDYSRTFYCIFFALQDTTPQNGGTLYLPWGSSAVVAPDLPAGSVVIFDQMGVLHRVGDNQGPPPGRPESMRWLAFQGLYSGTHDGDNPSVSQEDGYGSAFVDADYETAEALE